jgi:glycosyltransferase involved in cell wall biosynthesis
VENRPRISIITPSFNQGKYIAATIESAFNQHYPDLEHIVIDGGSKDDTLGILRRYPHLTVISEPDRGQADAINKGFRRATGQIWGFLNSDDTLLPDSLERVSREVDPVRGRHIIMGRCRFVDETGRFTGIEHPSRFGGHRRVLEIWKGHMIPQPAVFWTPEVWRTCGPLEEGLKSSWLDYDLFCRFSKRYDFHCVDQVLATYRLQPESKTAGRSEAERLAECIQISRRYWGSRFSPFYWQLAFSFWRYRLTLDRIERARNLYRRFQETRREQKPLAALPYAFAAGVLAPEVAFYNGIYPALRDRVPGVARTFLDRIGEKRRLDPQTEVYMNHTNLWSDSWGGPRLVFSRTAGPDARVLRVRGTTELKYLPRPFSLSVRVDNQELSGKQVVHKGDFALEFPLAQGFPAGDHEIEITASSWFVPHHYSHNHDYRPLAWRFVSVEFDVAQR